MYFVFIFVCASVLKGFAAQPCHQKSYGYSSFVCVCNSTYCDLLEPVSIPQRGEAYFYESSENQNRFYKSSIKFSSSSEPGNLVYEVNRSTTYQFILGFGGAFTDAAGINIASLPVSLQKTVINAYYSKSGLEYTMGRIPIASCDFSTHVYSYDDTPDDFNLTHFQLSKEDFKYKIPYIKMAQSLYSRQLLLFASPWSAPAWMKSNEQMYGMGTLKGKPGDKYYQTWAEYFVRFLRAYESQNITVWGITAQNEPMDGDIYNFAFQAMGFTPEMERDFIKYNLGPTLEKAGYGIENLKLMIMDDNRLLLPKWVDVVLNDPDAAKYVSGIAFHWYLNPFTKARLLDITHGKHQNVFLLSTEACTGSKPWEFPKVMLGSWQRAEEYAHDIIQDLLHWTVGWIDWNLAVDTQGGPNWVKNFVDAPIIVNKTAGEFYKQPMYYALAHFSKLLPPGSLRIALDTKNVRKLDLLDVAAFQTPQDATVVIIVNRYSNDVPIVLHDVQVGYLNMVIPAHAIQSYIWSVK